MGAQIFIITLYSDVLSGHWYPISLTSLLHLSAMLMAQFWMPNQSSHIPETYALQAKPTSMIDYTNLF